MWELRLIAALSSPRWGRHLPIGHSRPIETLVAEGTLIGLGTDNTYWQGQHGAPEPPADPQKERPDNQPVGEELRGGAAQVKGGPVIQKREGVPQVGVRSAMEGQRALAARVIQ